MIDRPAGWVLGAAALLVAGCSGSPRDRDSARVVFDREVVATARDAWGKALADLNGDGLLDVIVAERGRRRVVAYLAPQWNEQVLAAEIAPTTGLAAGDVNDDGAADVVVATDSGVVLLAAPDWSISPVGEGNMHDVRIADLDSDGRPDVVGRNQTAFREQPGEIRLFLQSADAAWKTQVLQTRQGEGLAVADVDRDGMLDLVINSAWYRNRGARDAAGLQFDLLEYAPRWEWPHASVSVAYIDSDDRLDIVLAPAELAGDRYRMSWFGQPRDSPVRWAEHVIANDLETVQHGLQAADFDGDGAVDVLRSQMAQGADPDQVAIHFNPRGSGEWRAAILGESGSHSVQAGDLEGDGDFDILGANWSGEATVELWRNQACDGVLGSRVKRSVIGENPAGKNLFALSADLDEDGRPDLAAGSRWYRNPGGGGAWEPREIGAGVGNVALLHDFDRDGMTDVLYTPWTGQGAESRLGVAWNRGPEGFEVAEPLSGTAGDFLQGVAVVDGGEAQTRVALSWHDGGRGVEILQIPVSRDESASRAWIADASQDEALSAGDIDGDGDPDLLLGTQWLENAAGAWRLRVISQTDGKPDRNVLVDMNGDGRLDAVVGFEAISTPGGVVWYENPGDAQEQWREHEIAEVIGPMSLDAVDVDGDGDIDVFVGEHNLQSPESARLWLLRNDGGSWSQQVAWQGDEHHDGLVAADLDADGDVDVASVGWSHGRVHLYESLAAPCLAARGDRPGGHTRAAAR